MGYAASYGRSLVIFQSTDLCLDMEVSMPQHKSGASIDTCVWWEISSAHSLYPLCILVALVQGWITWAFWCSRKSPDSIHIFQWWKCVQESTLQQWVHHKSWNGFKFFLQHSQTSHDNTFNRIETFLKMSPSVSFGFCWVREITSCMRSPKPKACFCICVIYYTAFAMST